MNLYPIVKYLHLMTLVFAAGTSSLAHFAMTRRQKATTAREAAQWHRMGGSVARMFPLALVLFFVTGGYMVSKTWGWKAGFVQAGVIGALALLVNGIIAGKRAVAIVPALIQAGDAPLTDETRALIHDPVLNTIPWINHMIALAVALVMVVKPSLTAALTILLAGIAIGLLLANRFSPARKQAAAAQTASA